jgi:DNA-binding NarL/FixJ family response regulator
MRLLIIDDNAHFLEAARNFLHREGLDVVAVATSGAEAIDRAREHQPDVILVDVDLGVESGFDVARQLAAATSGVRASVILISATPEQDLIDLIDESPAIGFVSKTALARDAIAGLLDSAQERRSDPG